jgi:type I restriction enzyme S subunit
MGNLGIEWCPTPYWVIDTAYYVTPKLPDVDLKFFYYLTSYVGLNHLKDGTSNPSLSRDTFYAQLLPHPPREVQKAITEILGSLDDKIELNRRMNETLEAMARTLFRSWFVDFDPVRAKDDGRRPSGLDAATAALFPAAFEDSLLGPIPKGWRAVSLGDFCTAITDGSHHSPRSVDTGPPMASVKDMTDWGITVETCRRISQVDYDLLVSNGCSPKLGDVLLAKDGATCLETACEYQQDDQLVLLSSVAILRPRDKAHSPYLHLWLKWDATKTYLRDGFVSGSAIPRIVLKDLKRAQLIRPADTVISVFHRTVEPLRSRIRANTQQSRTLAALRDALLPKLLSGELRVKEAERMVEVAS